MAEDATVSPIEIREVAERAFKLQSYILRRSWGVLYAALSLAMFVTIFISPREPSVVLRLVLDTTTSGTALIAILWTFKRARDTAEVRHAVGRTRWSRPLGYRLLLPVWVSIHASLILVVILFRSEAVPLILVVYAVMAAYLCYALKLSFPSRLPLEGVVTLSSLGIAAIGSISLLPFIRESAPYGILWGATVAIWLCAAAYARTRRPPGSLEGRAV
jgi:hypothetical protein